MKVEYKFANGEVSYVEVSDELGAEILKSRRIEENGARKERYHCYSMDAVDYEGEEFADIDTPESLLLNKEGDGRIKEFFGTLTETQRRRVEMKLDGWKLKQIAKRERVDFRAVKDTFKQVQKKFESFFGKTLHF